MSLPMVLLRYILREMSKVFLLTALALSAILGLGGGLLKVIKLGEMTPGQLLWLMALVLPVAAALTLPIAALFSASATYGRLSADNEFVACRSSGINMHVLFLPTLALGLASATVTFLFINFLIPGMVRNLNEFVAMDVGAMIQQRLKRPRGITLGGRFRIHADSSAASSADPNEVVLRKVAFVEVDDEEWVRFGTAGEVRLRFDRGERSLRVSGRMRNLSYYDRKDSRFGDVAEQELPPNELPAVVPLEIKFLNLGQLFHYWRNPGEWREVMEESERLRRAIGSRFVYDDILESWRDGEGLTLEDDRLRITIRSPGRPMRIPRDGGIEIANATIEQHHRGRVRRVSANRAVIELVRGGSLEESGIQIQAYDAKVTTDERTIDRVRETLGPVAAAAEIISRAKITT